MNTLLDDHSKLQNDLTAEKTVLFQLNMQIEDVQQELQQTQNQVTAKQSRLAQEIVHSEGLEALNKLHNKTVAQLENEAKLVSAEKQERRTAFQLQREQLEEEACAFWHSCSTSAIDALCENRANQLAEESNKREAIEENVTTKTKQLAQLNLQAGQENVTIVKTLNQASMVQMALNKRKASLNRKAHDGPSPEIVEKQQVLAGIEASICDMHTQLHSAKRILTAI